MTLRNGRPIYVKDCRMDMLLVLIWIACQGNPIHRYQATHCNGQNARHIENRCSVTHNALVPVRVLPEI